MEPEAGPIQDTPCTIGDLESLPWLKVKFIGQKPKKKKTTKTKEKWCFFGAKGCITQKGVQSILQLTPDRMVKGAPRNSVSVQSYGASKLGVFSKKCGILDILETQKWGGVRRQVTKTSVNRCLDASSSSLLRLVAGLASRQGGSVSGTGTEEKARNSGN